VRFILQSVVALAANMLNGALRKFVFERRVDPLMGILKVIKTGEYSLVFDPVTLVKMLLLHKCEFVRLKLNISACEQLEESIAVNVSEVGFVCISALGHEIVAHLLVVVAFVGGLAEETSCDWLLLH
jgi:hypothetical protein